MLALTKETSGSINHKMAIKILKDGNIRFINNLKVNRNLLKQMNETSQGQHPFAIILSCIDSRTSAELIFDQGLGDIFSCRIAGNIINEDIIGSMEFACKVAGAKLIMVLGHTNCGAIKGACDKVEMGNLTNLLRKISPAVDLVKLAEQDFDAKDIAYIDKVASINVKLKVSEICQKSSILEQMKAAGEIDIIGAMYDVATGVVLFDD